MSRTAKLVFFFSLILLPGTARAGKVELVSRAAPGGQAQAVGQTGGALISADGNWVAFASTAPDLVPGQADGNSANDVFLVNRATNAVTLVSHAAGSPTRAGNSLTLPPGAISADGRYVAYISSSSDLVTAQTSAATFNAFLWDRVSDTTVLVSHVPGSTILGAYTATVSGISDDGRYVAFLSPSAGLIAGGADTNNLNDLFLWDRTTGDVALVSRAAGSAVTAGNEETFSASLTGDGRWIAFASKASNLVAGGTDTNGAIDVFLWDRTTGTVALVSHVDGDPLTAPATSSGFPVISRDGNWIAFSSASSYFVRERATDTLTLITHAPGAPSTPAGGASTGLTVSDDGSWVVFGDTSSSLVSGQIDTNSNIDVFLWDRATNTNALVSHSTAGAATAGNAGSLYAWIAVDGGRVVFWSLATDLVAGGADSNGTYDAFQWERNGGTVTLISHVTASPGTAGNGSSVVNGMSADGNFVVFESAASDLAPADTNNGHDVFLWDRAAGTSTALSLSPAAVSSTPDQGVTFVQPHQLSADGRYAVYLSKSAHAVSGQTDSNGELDVFLVDRSAGTTTLVSHGTASATTAGNKGCQDVAISADGRWVAFSSGATDLLPVFTPRPSSQFEIFLWDRVTGTTVLASHSSGSSTTGSCFFCNLPAISDDGGFVAYTDAVSGAYLYNRGTGANLKLISAAAYDARISGDGQFIAFLSNALLPGQTGPDGSNVFNVYLYDRAAATTTLVSHVSGSPAQRSTGCQPDPLEINTDGRWVAYQCEATDLVAGQVDTAESRDAFLYDRTTVTNSLVSHAAGSAATAGNGESFLPWLSLDGRWLAFSSAATDLLTGITDTNNEYDAFLFDRTTGTTILLSHKAASSTEASAGRSYALGLSADGRIVAVLSAAPDLMTGITDLNAADDLFLIEPATGAVELMSHTPAGPAVTGNGAAYFYPSFSADGSVVLFSSYASDLAAGDRNLSLDVFAYLRGMGYHTLTPCRLFDSRQPQDGPAVVSGATVSLQPLGACGIPATARALSLNLTVTGATGGGHVILFPGGTAVPGTSTINFTAGATRANNAVLSLGGDGTLAVKPFVSGNGTVHVILDVAGYFQ